MFLYLRLETVLTLPPGTSLPGTSYLSSSTTFVYPFSVFPSKKFEHVQVLLLPTKPLVVHSLTGLTPVFFLQPGVTLLTVTGQYPDLGRDGDLPRHVPHTPAGTPPTPFPCTLVLSHTGPTLRLLALPG